MKKNIHWLLKELDLWVPLHTVRAAFGTLPVDVTRRSSSSDSRRPAALAAMGDLTISLRVSRKDISI